jgi:hypothetical protein
VNGICQDTPEGPWWTDSSLCTLPNDPNFNLIFTQDMQAWPAYKLTASNPGQFYYNTLIDDTFTSGTLTITVPYPFITQGAVPAHVYSYVTVKQNGATCYIPGSEVDNFDTLLTLSAYSGAYGTTTTYVLTGVPTPPPGMTYYLNVHLDYGLKGTTGYTNDGNSNALKYGTTNVLIPNLKSYSISDSFWGSTITDGITNINIFKKNPGFGAEVTSGSDEDPVAGAVVKIFAGTNTAGKLIGTMTTDEYGFAMYTYKHTGKIAAYTLQLQGPPAQVQTIYLKSNKFIMTEWTV